MDIVMAWARDLLAQIFSLTTVYAITGMLLLALAARTWSDRTHPHRRSSAAFWAILGIVFVLGDVLPNRVTGLMVIAMVAIDGISRMEAPPVARVSERTSGAIFLPVLAVPVVTFATAIVFGRLGLDVNTGALVGLGFSGVVAMLAAVRLTGASATLLLDEGRRLNDAVGAVSILPQLLASLGTLFAAAQVGQILARGVQTLIAADSAFLVVLATCATMSLLTMAMGNSFAAFPVVAAGLLVPLVVAPYGVDPALAAIVTLTAGSSGTLCTPMAANFNLVPAALLDMRNPYGVIRFQLPFALALWTAHVAVLYAAVRWVQLAR